MRIYNQKLLDVAVDGKLRSVSVSELCRLIEDGQTPAITKQGMADLKRLSGLLAGIFIKGDWLLQSPCPNSKGTGPHNQRAKTLQTLLAPLRQTLRLTVSPFLTLAE